MAQPVSGEGFAGFAVGDELDTPAVSPRPRTSPTYSLLQHEQLPPQSCTGVEPVVVGASDRTGPGGRSATSLFIDRAHLPAAGPVAAEHMRRTSSWRYGPSVEARADRPFTAGCGEVQRFFAAARAIHLLRPGPAGTDRKPTGAVLRPTCMRVLARRVGLRVSRSWPIEHPFWRSCRLMP